MSQPLVSQVAFGDGYELRVSESLNRVKTGYNVLFSRTCDEALEIQKFLMDRAGIEAFKWTTPLGETDKLWVCRQWSGPTQQARGVYVVSATFEEVFE